jgi:hypothetical protein
MSRSSATERSADRAAVEPLVALSAVLVLGVTLSVYAVGVERALPGSDDRALAGPTLEAATDQLTRNGLVRPTRLDASAVAPPGHELRVELRVDGQSWTDGPPAPRSARTATRQVSVRVGPGQVRPGRLRVEVWS